MKATKVNAGLAESNDRLLPGIWRDSLHVTCGLTACTLGSAPGPTLGNEYGKTLPLTFSSCLNFFTERHAISMGRLFRLYQTVVRLNSHRQLCLSRIGGPWSKSLKTAVVVSTIFATSNIILRCSNNADNSASWPCWGELAGRRIDLLFPRQPYCHPRYRLFLLTIRMWVITGILRILWIHTKTTRQTGVGDLRRSDWISSSWVGSDF